METFDWRIFAHTLDQGLDSVHQEMRGGETVAYLFKTLRVHRSRGGSVCWLKASNVTLCQTPHPTVFAVITPLRAASGVTVQTEAFTSPSLSFGSWRLAAVLGGATFSDNGEWKPSISSDTGGGSQSQVLLPPCNKQFQEANCSRLTRW